MSMPAVSKHLRVLERAGLIARGREAQWRPCRIEPAPLKEVADWTERYRQIWEQRFDRLETYLQELQSEGEDTWSSSRVANSETFKVTTPSDSEIRMTRLFDAPRAARVRGDDQARAHPAVVGHLGEGYSVPVCEIDLRAGGKWRFVGRAPEGRQPAFYGVYREIVPPERDRLHRNLRAVSRCASRS